MIVELFQGFHRQPGKEARLLQNGNEEEHACEQPQGFPVDIREGFVGTEDAEDDEQPAADECHPMTWEFFTSDHDVSEHEDEECEKHGCLDSNIRSDIYMDFIVWNRDRVTITPMEYFVQTSKAWEQYVLFFITQMDRLCKTLM